MLVDTAGLRRKRKQRQGIEYYSELRALEAAERADVALVLVDATRGDRRAGSHRRRRRAQGAAARRSSCSRSGTSTELDDRRGAGPPAPRLRQRPPVIAVSAKTGRGVDRLLDKVEELFAKHAGRITTGELNRVLGELTEARPGAAGRAGEPAQAALRHAGEHAPAALPHLRQRPRASSRATTATGSRTSCASASSSRACRCRSTSSERVGEASPDASSGGCVRSSAVGRGGRRSRAARATAGTR